MDDKKAIEFLTASLQHQDITARRQAALVLAILKLPDMEYLNVNGQQN